MNLDIKLLKDILLKQGYISDEEMIKAETSNSADPISFLISNEILTKQLVGQAIAEYFKVTYVDLGTSKNVPKSDQVLKIPEFLAKKYKVVLAKETKEEAIIAIDDPENVSFAKEKLAEVFPGKKIKFAYSDSEDIDNVLLAYRKPLDTRIKSIEKSSISAASEILNEIIEDAIEFNASDIHLEPREDDVQIRFRIDGVLREAGIVNKDLYTNVLNRIKVTALLRIDEHFTPQDGAIRFESDDKVVDLRVSIVPTLDGEKVVIRILSVYVKAFTLADLGLSRDDEKIVKEAYTKPFGMILTTGPTGSGKTTTLYSIVKILNSPDVNITTIEDPVEYKIQGVNQIQVNQQTELTFARGLRSIVRQDPNVILVGEIRDGETAEIAVNAALTGHLLLSTFHANDAATAIPRLLDMGIEPFLLASTLNLIVAQRLARKICRNCRYSVEYKTDELKEYMPDPSLYFTGKEATLYQGKGCERCNGSGYKGRTAIYELIYITSELRDLILQNPSSQQIWQLARSQGARTFFDDGMSKVGEGEISIEELTRVAPQSKTGSEVYGGAKK